MNDKRRPPHRSRQVRVIHSTILLLFVAFALSYWVSTTALKRRFDSIEIGMQRYQVLQLLGPSQPQTRIKQFVPNYAELIEIADGIVTHQKFGAWWKSYWLYTSVTSRSDTWGNQDKLIIVNYDANRRINEIVWLERHSDSTPWLATLLSPFAVTKEFVYDRKTHPL